MSYTVYVDSREAESKPQIHDGLIKLGAEVIVENLGNAVDYLIPSINGTRHGIQRKTAWEMLNPRKMFEDIIQIKSMENTECYILLEGSLGMLSKPRGTYKGQMPIAAIIGGLESVMLDYDVKIIPSPSYFWSANWLYRRAVKLGSVKVKKPMSVGEKLDRELPLYEQGRKIIETLPDIGPKLAIRIMEQFSTARNAIDNLEKWILIDGIGAVKVSTVRAVLDAPWQGKKAISGEGVGVGNGEAA